jgi:hypothetical protein
MAGTADATARPGRLLSADLHAAGRMARACADPRPDRPRPLDGLRLGKRCIVSARTTGSCREHREPSRCCTPHSRRLDFHPHVHLIVPAAAVDTGKRRWRRKRRGKNGTYLFNEKALAKVFRAKMLAAIEAAGIPPAGALSEGVGGALQIGRQRREGIDLSRSLPSTGASSAKRISSPARTAR